MELARLFFHSHCQSPQARFACDQSKSLSLSQITFIAIFLRASIHPAPFG